MGRRDEHDLGSTAGQGGDVDALLVDRDRNHVAAGTGRRGADRRDRAGVLVGLSGGLFALLDDVAALARLAAASVDDVGAAAGRASAKAAGVVVDDTAVTPQYVAGVAAKRELPIIKKIARGSLRNKILFILPAALLLSEFLPWLLTPLLMVGGTYLCYEGAEKVWERVSGTTRRRRRPRSSSVPSTRGRWSPARSAPTSSCRPRSW